MDGIGTYAEHAVGSPLSRSQKAAAILIAMGKPVAGKLLKFFSAPELRTIISSAQSLRSIPSQELDSIVTEFEDLFTEGAGLMDNARAMEGILEEGLPPEQVDGLLGRQRPSLDKDATIWEQLQTLDPADLGRFLLKEHTQTVAYVVSKLPPPFAARILVTMPDDRRAGIVHRVVNMKPVNGNIATIIEQRVGQLLGEMSTDQSSAAADRVAEMMNEMEKSDVDALLGDLETISSEDAAKVKPKVFLFDDLPTMPMRSRITLFNDLKQETISVALQGANDAVREAVLSAMGARQRRMIEADLSDGIGNITARDIAIARRMITQEAIRLSSQDQITLKEEETAEAA